MRRIWVLLVKYQISFEIVLTSFDFQLHWWIHRLPHLLAVPCRSLFLLHTLWMILSHTLRIRFAIFYNETKWCARIIEPHQHLPSPMPLQHHNLRFQWSNLQDQLLYSSCINRNSFEYRSLPKRGRCSSSGKSPYPQFPSQEYPISS